MKNTLLFLLVISFYSISSFAQSGQGYMFTYDGAGYRIKREFHTNPISYTKPGKDSETPIDTLVGAFEEEKNLHSKQSVVVKVYPNPAKERLYIENHSWENGTTAKIMIFDIGGRKLFEEDVTKPKKEIDIKFLVPGSYQVGYKMDNGQMFTWKIVML